MVRQTVARLNFEGTLRNVIADDAKAVIVTAPAQSLHRTHESFALVLHLPQAALPDNAGGTGNDCIGT